MRFHDLYGPNFNGRDFIVGDIHGMLNEFITLLEDVNFNFDKDRCFSVGDLIDRGYDSVSCLKLIREDWFFPVRGNHEMLMYNAISGGSSSDYQLWLMNGGGWSSEFSLDYLEHLVKMIEDIPQYITLEHSTGRIIGICHAEPPTNDWLDIGSEEDASILSSEADVKATWGRSRITTEDKQEAIKNVDFTVHGHTILSEPRAVQNSIFIDTGSFLSQESWPRHEGKITLIRIENLGDFLC